MGKIELMPNIIQKHNKAFKVITTIIMIPIFLSLLIIIQFICHSKFCDFSDLYYMVANFGINPYLISVIPIIASLLYFYTKKIWCFLFCLSFAISNLFFTFYLFELLFYVT